MIHRIRHWWHSRNLDKNELCACWVSVGYTSDDDPCAGWAKQPAYPIELYPGCPCFACDSPTWPTVWSMPIARMSVCPTCGNKRCPGAADHRNECSGSNEPGQSGGLYA